MTTAQFINRFTCAFPSWSFRAFFSPSLHEDGKWFQANYNAETWNAHYLLWCVHSFAFCTHICEAGEKTESAKNVNERKRNKRSFLMHRNSWCVFFAFPFLSIPIEGRIEVHKWLELFGWKIIGVSVLHVGCAMRNAIHSDATRLHAPAKPWNMTNKWRKIMQCAEQLRRETSDDQTHTDWHSLISLISIRYSELEPTNYVVVRAQCVALFTFPRSTCIAYRISQRNGQESLSFDSPYKKKLPFQKKCYFLFTMLPIVITDAKCHNKANHSIQCSLFDVYFLMRNYWLDASAWMTNESHHLNGKEYSSFFSFVNRMNAIYRPKIGGVHLKYLSSLWNIYSSWNECSIFI